jgi:hypothetical protein
MRYPRTTSVIPPGALIMPMIAFSRVHELSEMPPDGPSFDPPKSGIPVVTVTVMVSNDGWMWEAISE